MHRGGLGTDERAFEIHVQHRIPLIVGHHFHFAVFHAHGQRIFVDAGVVDQDVESAKVGSGGLHHLLNVGAGGDTARHGNGLAAAVGHQFGRLIQRRLVHIRNDDARAFAGETERRRPANAPRPAGDECNFVLESHVSLFEIRD